MKNCPICRGTGIKPDSTRSIGSVIICSCQTQESAVHSRTDITKYTPAILRAVCKRERMSKRQFRLATLKRVECELGNVLENPASPWHDADHEAIADLHRAVRLAIGEE